MEDPMEMYRKFLRGEISEETWHHFCRERLYELLEQNKDVFIRLKDR